MRSRGADGVEAAYGQAVQDGRIVCGLCPHHCAIADGRNGRCRVRGVRNGRLMARGYGRVSSCQVDPVEKKPLYHFLPGQPVFSVGGWGCNFACAFCQNWSISQDFLEAGQDCLPEQVARRMRAEGCTMVAYTYNEPLTGFEFVLDACLAVKAAGGHNILVTNGYCEGAPAAEILPLVSALNVDIKGLSEAFYHDHCGGALAPVLRFCEQAVAASCHVEITCLMIPGLNDSDRHALDLAGWIRDHLGPGTPLHLSAYHPDYRMTVPATPAATLMRLRDRCHDLLPYVYIGNVRSHTGQDTSCPACGTTLVARQGYTVRREGLQGATCCRCGRPADFVL